jgi:hypothetical protein
MRTLALGLALVVLVLKAAAPIHAEPGIFESFWGSYVALVGDGVNFRDSDGVRIPTLSRRLAA